MRDGNGDFTTMSFDPPDDTEIHPEWFDETAPRNRGEEITQLREQLAKARTEFVETFVGQQDGYDQSIGDPHNHSVSHREDAEAMWEELFPPIPSAPPEPSARDALAALNRVLEVVRLDKQFIADGFTDEEFEDTYLYAAIQAVTDEDVAILRSVFAATAAAERSGRDG